MEQQRTAFIVEDNAHILENLTEALQEHAQVSVVGAASGEHQALEWLSDPGHAPDIVLIDLALSEGSGAGLLVALGRRKARGKVVVVTNYANHLIREHCLALGADCVFDKTHEIDALIEYCGGGESA